MKPSTSILRILTLTLLAAWLAVGSSSAYSDHRGRKVDSLEAVLSSGRPLTDEERMTAYIGLMNGYRNTNTQLSERYARSALALSYRMNTLNAREGALYSLGLTAYGRADYDAAADYFHHALAVTDSMRGDHRYSADDIDDNLSQLYGALGNLYNIQDKSLLAIDYYQRALPIFERHGWLESQCILHHNVAELYQTMGNAPKATQHYQLAIKAGEASGDSLMMALPRKGLAKVYMEQGDYDLTRQTLASAYSYYRAHRDEEPGDYAEVVASLATMHLMANHEDLTQARAFAQEALACDSEELMDEVRFGIYAAAALVAAREQQWQQALSYAQRSYHHDDDEATLSDVTSYELLANIHMHLGNTSEASYYINKVRAMEERFATDNYQSALSQMEVIYETQKKQDAIEQLTRERQWYLWGGALCLLVLLLLVLTFFLLWRSVRLSKRTTLIQAKLEGEMGERVRIARDLHDRLGGLLTSIRMQSEQTSMKEQVDEAIREMRNVAHHLLPDSLQRYGLRVALRDYCMTMSGVSFAFVGEERHIKHEEAVYCIVYELVNNAVKDASAQHISVQLMAADEYTAITVSDDGNGLSSDSTPMGSGLRNIRSRVEAIGGRIDISSAPGEGTEISIELPNVPIQH